MENTWHYLEEHFWFWCCTVGIRYLFVLASVLPVFIYRCLVRVEGWRFRKLRCERKWMSVGGWIFRRWVYGIFGTIFGWFSWAFSTWSWWRGFIKWVFREELPLSFGIAVDIICRFKYENVNEIDKSALILFFFKGMASLLNIISSFSFVAVNSIQ